MIRVVHPGSGSRIQIPTFYPTRNPDPGVKKGTGSRIRYTGPIPLSRLTCVRSLMLYDNILGVGLEVAELALEALDLGAVLAGDVDAELDLG